MTSVDDLSMRRDNTLVRQAAFRLAALGAAVAVGAHLSALIVSAFARSAYPPGYPPWRHVMFVAIDGTLACLFVTRRRWLVWPYAALTLQVLLGHGVAAWESWARTGHVAWIDAAATIGVPLGLVLLIVDRRTRRDAVNPRAAA